MFNNYNILSLNEISVMSLEELQKKEKEYEYYGFFIADIKSEIKKSLQDLINSATDNSKMKLSVNCPPEAVNESLEKMRNSYLSALEKHTSKLDVVIDEGLKLPESHNPGNNLDEEKMNHEINTLKMKLIALNKYRSELVKAENELLEDSTLVFSEQSDLLLKIEASSLQRLSEMSLLTDLFNKSYCGTTDLEKSVMNMSIG